jgi:putative oxidoreductase
MKYLPNIAGALLGLMFFAFGMMFLLNMIPKMDPPPEGTPAAHFMAAFGPTGYMHFVKVFEALGGILVAIPKTRNLGLLVLGPIIINIIAATVFVLGGVSALFNPILIVIVILTLFLLWCERKAFAGLIH